MSKNGPRNAAVLKLSIDVQNVLKMSKNELSISKKGSWQIEVSLKMT